LCTGANQLIAEEFARHQILFDFVFASDKNINLTGKNKADFLIQRLGWKKFDYIGDSYADFFVWASARKAILNNPSFLMKYLASKKFDVLKIFNDAPLLAVKNYFGIFRFHQWLKNSLLFIPLIASHEWGRVDSLSVLFLAFFSFSFCASSVYILNDLFDLESDRLHPRKKNRPFASGLVSIQNGLFSVVLLMSISYVLTIFITREYFIWLTLYFLLTCFYTFLLKRLLLIDCLSLAVLYTIRILAGAAAIQQDVSFWLLAFSVFIFLSLAFIKRYAELQLQYLNGKTEISGRSYLTGDTSLIQTLGVNAGFMSVLVLSLYINSFEILSLYSRPKWMWGTVPVLLFWISWVWLSAHRGRMHDDPLIFAFKDKVSLFAGALFLFFSLLAIGYI